MNGSPAPASQKLGAKLGRSDGFRKQGRAISQGERE